MREKYAGRGASSRRFAQKTGEVTFFVGGATEVAGPAIKSLNVRLAMPPSHF